MVDARMIEEFFNFDGIQERYFTPAEQKPEDPLEWLFVNPDVTSLGFETPTNYVTSGPFHPPIQAVSLATAEDTEATKKAERKIKNRESAERSRARKKAYICQLQNEVEQLKETNLKLKKSLEMLDTTIKDDAILREDKMKPSSSANF